MNLVLSSEEATTKNTKNTKNSGTASSLSLNDTTTGLPDRCSAGEKKEKRVALQFFVFIVSECEPRAIRVVRGQKE